MKKLAGFLCLLLCAPLARAQTFTLEQVLAKMDEVSRTFKSTEADMDRVHVTVLVNDQDTSSGKFYYVRQNKQPRVKLDVVKPAPQQILIDKGKLQIYYPKLKQIQEASLGDHQDQVEMITAMGFGQTSQDLKKNFTSIKLAPDEVIDGRKTTVLDLTPRDTGTFKSVRMWMDQQKWVAVQIKTTEAGGDYGTVKFTNTKINSAVPDSVFSLKLASKDVTYLRK
jgi:outer membrane lipoprotein-sorting protein